MRIDPDAQAVMIWLPSGETPTAEAFAFSLEKVRPPPPSQEPEPWWKFEDAVMHAIVVMRNHDKVPWIKVGDQIFGPSEITQAASGIRAMRKFGA
jgi:hypothetical protein